MIYFNNRYLKYKQAMNYLNIKSYVTLRKMINDGLPVINIDGVKLIDKEELDRYLKTKTHKEM